MQNAQAIDYAALSEPELVAFARTGRHEAFRAIMQRCNQRLFRIARAVLRDDVEAEDALQEAYTRAFAAIGRFRGESSVATWLTRIVLNEVHGRLARRRPIEGLETAEAEQAGRVVPFRGTVLGDDPEADAARAQIRRMVEKAVDALPEPYRLVFVLREVEELSVEETATELGLKPQTVKTRLHRARTRLRLALQTQVAETLRGAYPFLGARCARITEAVLARLP